MIATLALGGAFALRLFWWGVAVALIVGFSWILLLARKWDYGNTVSMLVFVLGISLEVMFDGSRLLLLVSLLGALVAWDLAGFHKRLATSDNTPEEDELIRTHLLRLSSVLLLGVALPLLTFAWQFDLEFWQVFLLGAILLVGLSQVFRQLKRSNQ